VRLTRAGIVGGAAYLIAGFGWLFGTTPPASPWLIGGWLLVVALAGTVIPGVANQVSLARAYLAAPALAYSLAPGHLGPLAVVVALAGLSDLVDGTIARRFDKPSTLGGGLDPVVDGLFLGALGVGLAIGGAFPLWLGLVVTLRYLLPALAGGILIASGRRPELRHTLTGQLSTALNLVLLGGICLFRGLGQDPVRIASAAEIVIPVATAATFVHLGWAARRQRPIAAPSGG
jgi:cardiolipin synthase